MIADKIVLYRLVLAVVLGGLIGIERGTQGRAAGLRTHILVCVGSCLVMMTSLYIFAMYKGGVSVAPGRIAAGVVTGIGFLGAGTIIRSGASIKGLTTAASIWVVAGIGLAAGCGFYNGAIMASALMLFSLLFLRGLEKRMGIK